MQHKYRICMALCIHFVCEIQFTQAFLYSTNMGVHMYTIYIFTTLLLNMYTACI